MSSEAHDDEHKNDATQPELRRRDLSRSHRPRKLRRYRREIVGAVFGFLATLLAGVLLPLVSPLPSLPARAFDSIRDAFRSYDSRLADDHKEDVLGREIWLDEPRILESSIQYIAQNWSDSVTETYAGEVIYHPVPDLVNNAPRFGGLPTIVVGRAVDSVLRSAPPDPDLGSQEVQLVGRDRTTAVYFTVRATSLDFEIEPNDIIAARGLVTAIEVTRYASGRRLRTVYFYAFEADFVDADATAATNPGLKEIVRELVR